MSRAVFHVVHRNLDDLWHIELNRMTIATFETRAAAVVDAQKRGNALESEGKLAQLLIHRQDGGIQMEYSYGKEPRRTKG